MGQGVHFSGPLKVDGVEIVSEGGTLPVKAGSLAYDSTTNRIVYYDGAEWKQAPVAIKEGSVTLALLDESIAPAFVVKFAGQHTTAGGDANETATVTGVLATDIVIATIEDNGANNVTLLQTAAAANAVNFTLSADPGTDCVINYMVLRSVLQ